MKFELPLPLAPTAFSIELRRTITHSTPGKQSQMADIPKFICIFLQRTYVRHTPTHPTNAECVQKIFQASLLECGNFLFSYDNSSTSWLFRTNHQSPGNPGSIYQRAPCSKKMEFVTSGLESIIKF